MRALRVAVTAIVMLSTLVAAAPVSARQCRIAPAASPTPSASPTQSASPTPSASPTAAPQAQPLVASGQIVDLERGYIVFATGDAFRLDPSAPIVDDTTSLPPAYAIGPGVFAAITIDPATALVTGVRTSLAPLAQGTPVASVPRSLVSVATPKQPNPDLAPPPLTLRSQLSHDVLVTIDVEVPPETPYADDIYITTDTSGWNAQAIEMQRLDGRRFRIQVHLKGGTQFRYLFTRGSWQSVERDRAGLQRQPRTLYVPGGDSMVVSLTVYRWADVQ